MKPPHRILRRLIPRTWYRKLNDMHRLRESRLHADAQAAAAALGTVDAYWRHRIDQVLASPDNAHIPRHEDAGKLAGGWITMHNGLQVSALGYYGSGILNMLVENKGVHEPQEERAFATVLPFIEPGSVILELGAYWAFYSMWFAQQVPGARCFLVEPDHGNMLSGQDNFRRNGFTGTFEQAYLGDKLEVYKDGVPVVTVDDLCARHGITRLGMLHADIQEAELRMLKGAERTLGAQLADFVFVSTHTDALHYACIDQLRAYGYQILAANDMQETCAGDGVIVARRPGLTEPARVEIAGNSAS